MKIKCVLCRRESDRMQRFKMSAEARKLHEDLYPGMSSDKVFAENGLCSDCQDLPAGKRWALAEKALNALTEEYRRELIRERYEKLLNRN